MLELDQESQEPEQQPLLESQDYQKTLHRHIFL